MRNWFIATKKECPIDSAVANRVPDEGSTGGRYFRLPTLLLLSLSFLGGLQRYDAVAVYDNSCKSACTTSSPNPPLILLFVMITIAVSPAMVVGTNFAIHAGGSGHVTRNLKPEDRLCLQQVLLPLRHLATSHGWQFSWLHRSRLLQASVSIPWTEAI